MKKSLAKTNPYLKNVAKRKKLVARGARTSSAVEGVKQQNRFLAIEITKRKPKKIHKTSNT